MSRDPRFLEKLTDVVGLSGNLHAKALVLCVDEKSQIQALDRTQPALPLKKRALRNNDHDYKRNGTTTFFAALELAHGKVIGQCYARHRHQEFLKFLKRLDAEFPFEKQLHLVMDNYGSHKHPRVQGWLARHPRFDAHFVQNSSSGLNLVERWFGELTGKRIRRGVFVSVDSLTAAIEEYMSTWNKDPKPFVWTATIESSMEKLSRCKQTLEKIQPGCTLPRSRKKKIDNTSRLGCISLDYIKLSIAAKGYYILKQENKSMDADKIREKARSFNGNIIDRDIITAVDFLKELRLAKAVS